MVNISYKNLIQIHNHAMVDCSNKHKFDQCLNVILTKFYSNLGVYNTLYWELNHYNEARIIARSALESILLFSYLITHLEEIPKYYDEAILLKFKNSFIEIKQSKSKSYTNLFSDTQLKLYQEGYIIKNKEIFKLLSNTRQKEILKVLNANEYTINNDNFNEIDKYLQKIELKFQKFHKLFIEMEKITDLQINVKDFLFSYYNEYSQICHGALYSCLDKTDEFDIFSDFNFIKWALDIPIIICDYVKMPISDNYRQLFFREVENLNRKINSIICTQ